MDFSIEFNVELAADISNDVADLVQVLVVSIVFKLIQELLLVLLISFVFEAKDFSWLSFCLLFIFFAAILFLLRGLVGIAVHSFDS